MLFRAIWKYFSRFLEKYFSYCTLHRAITSTYVTTYLYLHIKYLGVTTYLYLHIKYLYVTTYLYLHIKYLDVTTYLYLR